jgi:hypothetical protein
MKWFFRPSSLVLVAAGLSLTAGVFVFWRFGQGADYNRALPRPVPRGDQEIVWLNPATNAVNWERFVAAVHRLTIDRPDLGLQVVDARAFPNQTADVPEITISVQGKAGRLWLRWYKLTGDLGPGQWIEAFAQRQPPPLAIIGGGSSDWARDLALALQQRQGLFAAPPLFLITTATANEVGLDVELMKIYDQRTFRFCYTNRQMAKAVADFLWHQDDLRPDAEPIYLARWEDDPYSEDLFDQFHEVFGPDGEHGRLLLRARLAKAAARTWGWLAGRSATGGIPIGLDLEGFRETEMSALGPFVSLRILYSIGSFNRPNRWEDEAAEKLLRELDRHPGQQRPLLVVPAVPQPARRFLRAILRASPLEGRRFVVASGDAIDFNTIYRDRNLSWPIQDLPVALVFFCHRNPVDPIAFRPDRPGAESNPPDPSGATSTGTQDLLLYRDIVETAVDAAYPPGGLLKNADELWQRLKDGRSHFTPKGNQPSGSGEYVVCLRPQRQGDRVLPQARLQVWNRSADPTKGQNWNLISELTLEYSSETGD